MKELRRVHAGGKLPPAAQLFMADRKPPEELYDLASDPHEIRNLAASPEHKPVLERLRQAHRQWVEETQDLGLVPEPELVEREKKHGSRWAILRQPEAKGVIARLQSTAERASGAKDAVPQLRQALKDKDAAVRYWAATGLGNTGQAAQPAAAELLAALEDSSASVRIAAARALCLMDRESEALPVLLKELGSQQEWVRLNAAIVLDSIGEKARGALDALKQAMHPKQNRYVVRVINHTLNALLGTDNKVP